MSLEVAKDSLGWGHPPGFAKSDPCTTCPKARLRPPPQEYRPPYTPSTHPQSPRATREQPNFTPTVNHGPPWCGLRQSGPPTGGFSSHGLGDFLQLRPPAISPPINQSLSNSAWGMVCTVFTCMHGLRPGCSLVVAAQPKTPRIHSWTGGFSPINRPALPTPPTPCIYPLACIIPHLMTSSMHSYMHVASILGPIGAPEGFPLQWTGGFSPTLSGHQPPAMATMVPCTMAMLLLGSLETTHAVSTACRARY